MVRLSKCTQEIVLLKCVVNIIMWFFDNQLEVKDRMMSCQLHTISIN